MANTHGAFTWVQEEFEQNLGGGHEKLFGRTLRVTAQGKTNGYEATAVLGCCVIGEAAHPSNENYHFSPLGKTDKKSASTFNHHNKKAPHPPNHGHH